MTKQHEIKGRIYKVTKSAKKTFRGEAMFHIQVIRKNKTLLYAQGAKTFTATKAVERFPELTKEVA